MHDIMTSGHHDISTELRKWADAPIKSAAISKTLREAADEIERLRVINQELKDVRIDLQTVENIVGSVQDLLLAARRQYDTHLIQKDLIASKDDEIERLRKRDAVLELFAKAFPVDEYGQFPVTNGEDVWAAVLAYAQMKVEEARRG